MKELRKLLFLFAERRNQENNVASKNKKYLETKTPPTPPPEYNENIPDLD